MGAGSQVGARLSVVVEQVWRAEALAEMIVEAGLQPEIARTDENTPLVRTAVDARLVAIAGEWTRGAVKTVPPQWLPGPRELRAWTLASGTPEADRYLLGLDPHAPDTHSPLASAMMRVGIAPTLIGTRGSRPALRISGRRRLSRLVENVGEPPGNVDAFAQWPRSDASEPGGQFASARAECEIVSCRRGRTYRWRSEDRALWAAEEVEQKHWWQTGTAVAAATESPARATCAATRHSRVAY